MSLAFCQCGNPSELSREEINRLGRCSIHYGCKRCRALEARRERPLSCGREVKERIEAHTQRVIVRRCREALRRRGIEAPWFWKSQRNGLAGRQRMKVGIMNDETGQNK